ncbi:CopY/TcrY family copper transport repressor [Enterococcus sp. LJL98]
MSKKEAIKISEAEWEVMRVIWTLEETDAATINELLSEKMGWKFATIKTLLGRLVKKEVLKTQQVGKKYLYSANVSEAETFHGAREALFSHICATKIGEHLVEMIQDVALTESDIRRLRQTLEQKEATARIVCDCIPGQCQCEKHLKE